MTDPTAIIIATKERATPRVLFETIGVNIALRTDQTRAYEIAWSTTPTIDPLSRFRSCALGGFLRKKKTAEKRNQQNITSRKTSEGRTWKSIFMIFLDS